MGILGRVCISSNHTCQFKGPKSYCLIDYCHRTRLVCEMRLPSNKSENYIYCIIASKELLMMLCNGHISCEVKYTYCEVVYGYGLIAFPYYLPGISSKTTSTHNLNNECFVYLHGNLTSCPPPYLTYFRPSTISKT